MSTRVNLSLVDRYEQIPTIVKLREIIRKLWKLEIGYIDNTGFVIDHAKGKIIPPMNKICKGTLFCNKGLFLCDKSVKELNEALKSGAFPMGCVFDGICHLGFRMFAVPCYMEGEYIGAVFSCGFMTEKPTESDLRKMNEKMGVYTKSIDNPSSASNEIPVINEGSIEYLLEMIRFGINEMEGYREELRLKESEISDLNKQLKDRYGMGAIIGKTTVMQRLYNLVDKVADCDSTVLIMGENGTGKELVAKAIHYASVRKGNRFIAQNCSAFNDNLLDSELFGHVKGSFTGAFRNKKGLFEAADGGTFLLDEIGDMSPSLQVKVLRILQEGTFIPVGGTEAKKINVRIITATNKDLKGMVERGEFREDLYYRINVLNIHVPPLRDRREDIPLLVDSFIKKNSERMSRREKEISPEAMEALVNYYWPGNVRQLENEIEKVFVLSGKEEVISIDMLSKEVREGAIKAAELDLKGSLPNAVESLEKRMILDGLKKFNWNKSRLAKELGISRAGLIMKVSKYGFEKDSFAA